MEIPQAFSFGGSAEGEPWWVLGEVTARLTHDAFLETAVDLVYDPRRVADTQVPLHPAAERSYREKGFLS